MAAHYCIGNLCWICYPEYAPKPEDKIYKYWPEISQERQIPENKISGLLESLLISVFDQGLDEDEHFRALPEELNLDSMKAERAKISNDSLEVKLLDRMIADFESKGFEKL
jgi:hypothetical protein